MIPILGRLDLRGDFWRPDWPHCDGEAEQWPDLGGELPLLLQRRPRRGRLIVGFHEKVS